MSPKLPVYHVSIKIMEGDKMRDDDGDERDDPTESERMDES